MTNKRRAKKQVRQPGFFDLAERTDQLPEMGDPLAGMNAPIDGEAFRQTGSKTRWPGKTPMPAGRQRTKAVDGASASGAGVGCSGSNAMRE
ncbi:MAG TPA: hypothetical protein PLD80_09130 [Rugosibacter sp.]|nr:hypothetical protein [Rugosibacter sp.]